MDLIRRVGTRNAKAKGDRSASTFRACITGSLPAISSGHPPVPTTAAIKPTTYRRQFSRGNDGADNKNILPWRIQQKAMFTSGTTDEKSKITEDDNIGEALVDNDTFPSGLKRALKVTEENDSETSVTESAATEATNEAGDRPIYNSIMSSLQALQPTHLELIDNSHEHAGHAGNTREGSESHFQLSIVADAFDGLNLVKRHQLIYKILEQVMPEVHALQIQALAPEEADQKDETDLLERKILGTLDVDILEEDTQKLLDLDRFPVGSMDMEAFQATRELLFLWAGLGTPLSVQRTVDLLDRMVEEQKLNFSADLSADTIHNKLLTFGMLNSVVRNWGNCFKRAATTEVIMNPDALLGRIEYWSEQCPNLAPQTEILSKIMRAVVFRIQNVADAQYMESLLLKMEDARQNGITEMAPTIVEYNMVINAMAKVKDPEKAEAIFRRLCFDLDRGVHQIKPDYITFGTVLAAWKDSGREDAGARAEAILDAMIEIGRMEEDRRLELPSSQCYRSVLGAWCAPKTKHTLEQAERFLQRMIDDYVAGNDRARPNSANYGYIIHCWAQLGRPEESERVLRWMHNDFAHNHNMQAKPSTPQFNAAISAWTKSVGSPTSLQRAFSLFESMENMGVAPDTATYGTLLVGLSRAKDPSIGEQADALFREQKQRYTDGDDMCKPDALNYNAAMQCWGLVGNAYRVVALLHELVAEHQKGNLQISDDRPFCTALSALARSRDRNAIKEAETIFHETTRLCSTGVFDFQPSAGFYSSMQGCWASAELPLISGQKCLALLQEMQQKYAGGDKTMMPTEKHFKVAIDSFARTNNPHEAEEVWTLMLKSFLDGNSHAKPGGDSCKALLISWILSDSPDAITRTLEFMDRIAEVDRLEGMELRLDRNAYYFLLDLCAKSSNPQVAEGAEAILAKMKDIHDEGSGAVGPDTRCYNTVINGFKKAANGERAEALFWEMFKSNTEQGNSDVTPDDISVTTVLSAWSKSSNEFSVQRAEVFFERIQKLMGMGKLPNVKLDAVCVSALLTCLGKAETDEAADSAEKVFADLQERFRRGDESARPLEHCYRGLIQCLTQAGRVERAEELLFEMHGLFKDGRSELRPRFRTCNFVFRGWLSSSALEAPERAARIFRFMNQNLPAEEAPDALNYAGLLRCWARSRRPESGERAENLLLEMTKKFSPNRPLVKTCYSDLVCAWARSKDGTDRAEELLLRMCGDYKSRRSDVKPDLRAFVAVLAAISRSQSSALGVRCIRLVDELRDLTSLGGEESNKILDCWNNIPSNSKDRLSVFLGLMEEYDTPTDIAKGPAMEKSPENFKFALKF